MKLRKEPLLHFVAGGALLFAAYAWLDRDRADVDAQEPIRITEGDVQWLVDNSAWRFGDVANRGW